MKPVSRAKLMKASGPNETSEPCGGNDNCQEWSRDRMSACCETVRLIEEKHAFL